jgi:hypothetical protein
MTTQEPNEWVDRYWILIDDGYNHNDAIAEVCSKFGLTSYDEDKLIEMLNN